MSNFIFSRLRTTHHLTLCASLLGLAAGCAEAPESEELALDDDGAEAPHVRTDALLAADLKDPSGAYFASVKANGTGCPAGTWETNISADGKVFTTTFSRFVAEVSPSSKVSVKDCQLTVKLHSPQGLSFAVQEFSYGGYAYLDKGVQARQIASYYFAGAPGEASEARTELKGPLDDTFQFTDSLKTASLVYAPCGTERDLNIRTTLRVLNGDPAGTGNVNFTAIDGSTTLKFRLAWKKCEAAKKVAAPKEGAKEEEAAEEEEEKPAKKPAKKPEAKKPEAKKPSAEDIDAIVEGIFGGGGVKIVGVTRK